MTLVYIYILFSLLKYKVTTAVEDKVVEDQVTQDKVREERDFWRGVMENSVTEVERCVR